MNRFLSSAVCATAVLLSSVSIDAVMATASAQVDISLNFDTFHDQLASYGDWVYSDRWGEVWIPANVPDDFHPYGTAGHWAYTNDYGWTWASDYDWGDIPFHYGRWVNDPDNGWLWIPGYVWSPGWVVWRSNGQYTGWMPMPPDDAFLTGGSAGIDVGGLGISINFGNTSDYYGYSRWYGGGYDENAFAANWVFVGTGHLADVDYVRFVAPQANYVTIIHGTTNITNYTVVNNFVVNKSVDVHIVERASGHPIVAVAATSVIKKPQFIMHADVGRQAQMQMRQQMPRGTGLAGSAPKPSPKVVQSLSTNVAVHNGKQPAHLYTRDTVAKAPLPARPGGAAPGNTTPAGSMTGPRDTDQRRTETPNGTTPNAAAPANTPPRALGPDQNHVQPNGTTTPTDEMKRERHPSDVSQPATPTTPPGGETRTERGNSEQPSGATTPPERHERTVTPPTNSAPPATVEPSRKPSEQPKTTAPATPPSDDKKKDKDKKPKPGDTPPPQ